VELMDCQQARLASAGMFLADAMLRKDEGGR
jgi:hypothetical protein